VRNQLDTSDIACAGQSRHFAVGRKPQMRAGLNGTSTEIPCTVDADLFATVGRARGAARPGERGPASTKTSAVGMQGRTARGTGEILSSPRVGAAGADPKGNRRGGDRRREVGSAQ
jgi:hypothetical protein